jgi:hypothetical protein
MARIVKVVEEIDMMVGNSPAFIDEIVGCDANVGNLGLGEADYLQWVAAS